MLCWPSLSPASLKVFLQTIGAFCLKSHGSGQPFCGAHTESYAINRCSLSRLGLQNQGGESSSCTIPLSSPKTPGACHGQFRTCHPVVLCGEHRIFELREWIRQEEKATGISKRFVLLPACLVEWVWPACVCACRVQIILTLCHFW